MHLGGLDSQYLDKKYIGNSIKTGVVKLFIKMARVILWPILQAFVLSIYIYSHTSFPIVYCKVSRARSAPQGLTHAETVVDNQATSDVREALLRRCGHRCYTWSEVEWSYQSCASKLLNAMLRLWLHGQSKENTLSLTREHVAGDPHAFLRMVWSTAVIVVFTMGQTITLCHYDMTSPWQWQNSRPISSQDLSRTTGLERTENRALCPVPNTNVVPIHKLPSNISSSGNDMCCGWTQLSFTLPFSPLTELIPGNLCTKIKVSCPFGKLPSRVPKARRISVKYGGSRNAPATFSQNVHPPRSEKFIQYHFLASSYRCSRIQQLFWQEQKEFEGRDAYIRAGAGTYTS